jgi:hypothetical protein
MTRTTRACHKREHRGLTGGVTAPSPERRTRLLVAPAHRAHTATRGVRLFGVRRQTETAGSKSEQTSGSSPEEAQAPGFRFLRAPSPISSQVGTADADGSCRRFVDAVAGTPAKVRLPVPPERFGHATGTGSCGYRSRR